MNHTKLTDAVEQIKIATTEQDILNCWEVASDLRPHLVKEKFVQQVQEMMRQESYRIAYITGMENQEEKAVAFAGFRDMQKLFSGKTIYIDDLGTLPAFRGRGYGGKLLDYVYQLAKDSGKSIVQLDSGHQRQTAHRLYLNKGYRLAAHHFVNDIKR